MTEYRVSELARAAATSVRNIRVYQDRGLLPPPRREGRIGLYSEAHLARLRLIGRLLARGYTFATIGELFDAWARGRDLADTLGLREALTAPWTQEEPVRLTRAEVARRFGLPFSPEAVERATRLGMLVPDGPVTGGQEPKGYLVPSPSLLEAGAELCAAGVPLDVVLDLAAGVQDDMSRVARRFISLLLNHLADPERQGPAADLSVTETGPLPAEVTGELTGPLPAEVAERVVRLRPHAQRTVDALLLMAMQRETDRLLEQLAFNTTHEP